MEDTQVYETQSQDIFYSLSVQEEPAIWANLRLLKKSNKIYFLTADNVHIGRRIGENTVIDQFITIVENDFEKQDEFMRISSNHFAIKKMSQDSTAVGYQNVKPHEPAYIECIGRNGVVVNGVKLRSGQMMLLKNNSIIGFSSRKPFCCFKYENSNDKILPEKSYFSCKYSVGKMLGKGGCGEVYILYDLAITDRAQFKTYALKTIEYSDSKTVLDGDDENETYSQVVNEVNLMKNLNNHHVMRILDQDRSDRYLFIVLEYMSGGDLLGRIIQHYPKQKFMPENDAKFFFYQILLGVNYIHSQNVTHRDIKPENIILSHRGESPLVKLCDFGLSKGKSVMKTVCGTLIYCAPEIVLAEPHYTYKVDNWSLGCLLYAMLSGKVPFGDDGNVRNKIVNANYNFKYREFKMVSTAAISIIRLLLQRSPKHRCEIDEILANKWITEDSSIKERLSQVYDEHNLVNDLADDMEKTLILDDDTEIQHVSKRPRVG